jgi:hypothetical protein
MVFTPEDEESRGKPVPDYCRVLRFTGLRTAPICIIFTLDSNGQVKEMMFPKALDLDRPKRPRTMFTPEQLAVLEKRFNDKPYLIGKERTDLASHLQLTETQVIKFILHRITKNPDILDKSMVSESSNETQA